MRKCEICDSTQIIENFHTCYVDKAKFILSKCLKCSLIFKLKQNIPKIDLLGGDYYHLKTINSVINKRYIRHFSRRAASHLRYINKYYQGQKKSMLDIGCGAGMFMKKMENSGWLTKGVESDPLMYKHGIKSGLDIENTLFENFKTEKHFGLIYLSHVFDDLSNIQKVIRKIHSLLSENGLLFIEVPNFEKKSRLNKIKYEDLLSGNYFFTRRTLAKTLTLNKFKLLDIHTFEPIHINTPSQILMSPFKLYLKFYPPSFRSYLRGMFTKV